MRDTRMQLKKSLGQHFLINEERCVDIVELLPNKTFKCIRSRSRRWAITKYILEIPGINYRAIEAIIRK